MVAVATVVGAGVSQLAHPIIVLSSVVQFQSLLFIYLYVYFSLARFASLVSCA